MGIKKRKKSKSDNRRLIREQKRAEKKSKEKILRNHRLVNEIAPDGVNPNLNDKLLINDNGKVIHLRTFYAQKIPRNTTFAVSFKDMMEFPNSFTSVFVEPLTGNKANKSLEKDINSLISEEDQAMKDQEYNKVRRMRNRRQETEQWANDVMGAENSLFHVAFFITIYAESSEELENRTATLIELVGNNNIYLSNAYGYQMEAFLANQPLNKVTNYVDRSFSFVKPEGIKWHRMDKYSLSTIFAHTSTNFLHSEGVYIGYNLHDQSPVVLDIFNESNMGYGVLVCGKTGSGKSLLVKLLISRKMKWKPRFGIIDSESRGGSNRGEYSLVTEKYGGVNYQISRDTKEIMNIFELNTETEFDDITHERKVVLNRDRRINDMQDNLLSMILGKLEEKDYADIISTLKRILTDTIQDAFEERGIYHGDVDSLFTTGNIVKDGKLINGQVKKRLPTLGGVYPKWIKMYATATDEIDKKALKKILDSLKHHVRELHICHDCFKEYTESAYLELKSLDIRYSECTCGGQVESIKGTKPYYDGQSTIKMDRSVPITNIDISQLSEDEQESAQKIAMHLMKENFINKNSVLEAEAEELYIVMDENHKSLRDAFGRKFVTEVYRCARKRHTSPITATQSIADYTIYGEETAAIIKNSSTQLILKHGATDFEALEKATALKPSQIHATGKLGIGDCYIVTDEATAKVHVDYMQEIENEFCETNMAKIIDLEKRKKLDKMSEDELLDLYDAVGM